MKHIIFTLSFLLAFTLTSHAQSLELVYQQDTIRYNPAEFLIDAKANLKNISGAPVDLHAERRTNNLALNHETNFCWGEQCFGATFSNTITLGPVGMITLRNNQVDSMYKVSLAPNNSSGTTEVTMRFYNANDVNDFIEHSMVFVEDPTASISQDDLARGFDLSNPYPNPATEMAWVDYKLPTDVSKANLQITDMQGRVIALQAISTYEERAQVQTSDLSAGVYFLNLMAENRVIAVSKLRVK